MTPRSTWTPSPETGGGVTRCRLSPPPVPGTSTLCATGVGCASSTKGTSLSNDRSNSDDDLQVVIEITSTNGQYLDSIVVEDVDDVSSYLDTFVGADGPAPAQLEYLNSEGGVYGTEYVLWGLADGRTTSWRSVQAA